MNHWSFCFYFHWPLSHSHRYQKSLNRLLKVCYVPTTSTGLKRLCFFLLLRPLTVLMKQTRQVVRAIKQSTSLRCLWPQRLYSHFENLTFWHDDILPIEHLTLPTSSWHFILNFFHFEILIFWHVKLWGNVYLKDELSVITKISVIELFWPKPTLWQKIVTILFDIAVLSNHGRALCLKLWCRFTKTFQELFLLDCLRKLVLVNYSEEELSWIFSQRIYKIIFYKIFIILF